ncbi:metal ABC transporter permease [Sulfitobacter mediterraneus]|uniref:metal ABC transporter permease n=1 Tax=Sulfitobacter mediterraneus TaxID=83219 RepID=UPI00193A6982|nr:metal ABC transporter permease [Sulfitobacter mediterraneus]MBM1555054.1 metal ABC transporter permease [Sulfitobacter mediterraneus]MBM1567393.1 metal ABC transporter permease [Sulfitobacter mediterraneus]MBM1571195.1 metal ABC transporter permease [Sulfitobacter mediterraneus]MBM1574995.1 metal ABC transporter permease [Sulfitobacter mediterraneus]MBM1578012.1 metal ABC transporter permease [Sulfitobacter mediterraneus]
MIFDALLLQLGYNATLVTLGAALLGMAAGVGGTFLFLRKRALVSDAISHATLPGVALAFMVMVALGGDGRNLIGLLCGAAISAAAGLLLVSWLSSKTRLAEDAAIGSVLSVFFGFGIVLLTVIQTMSAGRQAGLEGFLLGSTAGMLRSDALVIAVSAAVTLALVLLMRRPLTLAAFDPEYGTSLGQNVPRTDLAMMGLVLAVTVVGLKIVGLILIVALLIIPPVTARFWTERTNHVVLISGLLGGVSAYVGAALSAALPDVPTGPIIVLVGFALFLISLLLAPQRGLVSAVTRHLGYQRQVHLRQGLLALAHGQPIYERMTLRLLRKRGWALPDGVATPEGKGRAAKAMRDETRWQEIRRDPAFEVAASRYDGLTAIESVLTPDQIIEVDRRIGRAGPVPA